MKRTSLLVLFLLLIAVLVTACSPAATPAPEQPAAVPTGEPEPTAVPTAVVEITPTPSEDTAPVEGTDPITLTDGIGYEITLEGPAQKVVSIAPSNTELLFAVGAGDQVVGRDLFSLYPPEAEQIHSVGGDMGNFSLEEIARLQPDLVLASPLTAPETIEGMKEVTPNVFVIPNPTDLEGMYANIVTVGELTGHKGDAEDLVAGLRARAETVLEKTAGITERPKVYYELDATDPAKPWTPGPGTFVDLLIRLAGGENVGASLSGEWAQISQEELIVQDPDIILLGNSLPIYGGMTPEQVAARPGWDVLQAVQNNKVLPFNDDLVSRPGPRMIDGLEELARVFHPESFE